MLRKPAITLFGALIASLQLTACNQNSPANTAAVENAPASEPAVAPSIATTTDGQSAVAMASEIPAGCQIQSSGKWMASVNAQPPGSPRLTVLGEVETSTGGFDVTLERVGTDFNPGIVTLELKVVPPPADAMVSQMITPHAVKVEVPDVSRDLKLVVVNCGGGKLSEIAEIPVMD